MTDEVPIEAFLRNQGFDTGAAAGRARAVLEAAGLTRPGKRAFIATKRPAAERVLAETLVRVCGEQCLAVDRASGEGAAREAVAVTKTSCEVCGGSNNQRAALEARDLLARRGVRRIALVGGAPGAWDGLQRAFQGMDVEWRIVDGTSHSHTARDAEANKRWAQLIIIWASTELRHALSEHYRSADGFDVRIITAPRRGVAALCGAIVESYR